jgi:hypothetical protein
MKQRREVSLQLYVPVSCRFARDEHMANSLPGISCGWNVENEVGRSGESCSPE